MKSTIDSAKVTETKLESMRDDIIEGQRRSDKITWLAVGAFTAVSYLGPELLKLLTHH